MKQAVVVPLRVSSNAHGHACLALRDVGGITPLGIMARRFPGTPLVAAVSSYGLTPEARRCIEEAGFRLVVGEDLDVLGRLLAGASAVGAESIFRIPVESMWLDLRSVGVVGGPRNIGAEQGLCGEAWPLEELERLAASSCDRSRPWDAWTRIVRPDQSSRRIALECEEDLEDLRLLLDSGSVQPDSPLSEVIAAYEALDRQRRDEARASFIPRARRRKVVFVSGTTLYGGSEEFLRETIAWTRETGAAVEVILPGEGVLADRLGEDEVTARRMPVPARRLSPPGRFERDLAALRDAVADAAVVVAKNLSAPEAVVPATRDAGVECWVHLHAILSPVEIASRGIHLADRVIGDSRAVIAGVEPGKGVVLPNGVDLAYWTAGERATRKRPLLMMAVRTEPHKGHEVFIEAAEILAGEGLAFDLKMIGAATDPRAASFVERLRRRLAGGPLADRYELAGWSRDLRSEMRTADVFVMPTLPPGEPFGRVGIYAMALGVPVVASRLGGPLEYVSDHETGYLFEPGAADQLACRLRPLIMDSLLRERLGAAAKVAVKEFELERIAYRWKMMLEEAFRRARV